MVDDVVVSVHKVIPSNGCRCSFNSDCVLWCIGDDEDPIRFTDRDQENNMGVANGERGGKVGGRGSSFCICWAGECFGCVN